MKSFPCLSDGDQQRLRSILEHHAPAPWPNPEQAAALRKVLEPTTKVGDGADLRHRVGFLDDLLLVSVTDDQDSYGFRIVMPGDADTDADHLSVLQPVALAVLGRRVGETVSWECPGGAREMRVAEVRKSSELTV